MEMLGNWIKWENVGEHLEVELKSIQYNKNGNPFAVCERLDTLSEGESSRVQFNISKADVGLKPARYDVKVVSINNGFGFVEFKPLQDSSWDIHDKEVEKQPETVNEEEMMVKPISMQRREKERILESMQATKAYIQSLSYKNESILYLIHEIERELYLQLGNAVATELEDK